MGYGRTWSLPPLGEGEAYAHSTWANKNGVKEGDIIYFEISPRNVFGQLMYVIVKKNYITSFGHSSFTKVIIGVEKKGILRY